MTNGIAITAIVVSLLSPILGALADKGGYRKFFLILFTLDKVKRNNIKTYPKKKYSIKTRIIKYFLSFFYLIFYCLKNDCVIFSLQNNIVAIIVSILTNKKIIIRLNTSPDKYSNSYFKKIFFSLFYNFSDIILVNDEDFRIKVKEYFKLDSKIIHNCIDIDMAQEFYIYCNEWSGDSDGWENDATVGTDTIICDLEVNNVDFGGSDYYPQPEIAIEQTCSSFSTYANDLLANMLDEVGEGATVEDFHISARCYNNNNHYYYIPRVFNYYRY